MTGPIIKTRWYSLKFPAGWLRAEVQPLILKSGDPNLCRKVSPFIYLEQKKVPLLYLKIKPKTAN